MTRTLSELEQALAKLPELTITSRYLGEAAEEGWKHDRWEVTIARGKVTYTTSYRTGLGHREKKLNRVTRFEVAHPAPPKLADVLSCLLSDAQMGHQSFESFCGELGYDTDSRKALRTWEACVETEGPLRRVLGEHFETLSGLEH